MKMKAIKLFSMAVAALMMAACSNEDNDVQQPAQPQATKMHFTATIAAPNSTTRTVYTPGKDTNNKDIINVAWKEGDQIALIHGGVKDVVTVGNPNTDGSAPISGTITVGTDGEDVVLAYPAAAVYSTTPYGTLPFTPNPTCWDKAHAQDGTLEFIQNNIDFRMGSGKLSVSGDPATASLKANVSMPSMISIWKLTLQDNTSAALSATAVTVKANGELVAGATSAGKSEYYLCMVPSFIPAGDLVIEATDGSDTYTYTKAGGVSLETSKYYQSTVTMTKAAPAATSLSELKTAINGGTDCSSYIGWEVNSAGAIAESGISGTKIGYVAYVSTSDVDADVSGSRILVIASADASATALTWGSFGTARGVEAVENANDLNGYSNTNTLQGYGEEAHPAAYAAWNYGATIPSGGATPAHWFMPTMKQWKNMRDAKGGTYSAMATAYGIDGNYWTSNEYFNGTDYSECDSYAWIFVTNSDFNSLMKFFDNNVRSIFAY